MTAAVNKTGPAVAGPELLSLMVTELRVKKANIAPTASAILQSAQKKRGTAVNRALIHLPHGVDVTYRNLSESRIACEKNLHTLSKMKPARVRRGPLSFRPWQMSCGGFAP